MSGSQSRVGAVLPSCIPKYLSQEKCARLANPHRPGMRKRPPQEAHRLEMMPHPRPLRDTQQLQSQGSPRPAWS